MLRGLRGTPPRPCCANVAHEARSACSGRYAALRLGRRIAAPAVRGLRKVEAVQAAALPLRLVRAAALALHAAFAHRAQADTPRCRRCTARRPLTERQRAACNNMRWRTSPRRSRVGSARADSRRATLFGGMCRTAAASRASLCSTWTTSARGSTTLSASSTGSSSACSCCTPHRLSGAAPKWDSA